MQRPEGVVEFSFNFAKVRQDERSEQLQRLAILTTTCTARRGSACAVSDSSLPLANYTTVMHSAKGLVCALCGLKSVPESWSKNKEVAARELSSIRRHALQSSVTDRGCTSSQSSWFQGATCKYARIARAHTGCLVDHDCGRTESVR